MQHSSLLLLLDSFHEKTVLVLGDVMLDRFIYGDIERISPEAPIPILAIRETSDMPGGAANVIRNVVALGARAVLIGVVGDDDSGKILQAQLSQLPNVETRLELDATRPTTTKTRFVAERQQVLRADREIQVPVGSSIEDALIADFESALPTSHAVVLSDYAKGVLTERVLETVILRARSLGKPILIDPKGRDFSKYRGATVLTPNRVELQAATGLKCRSDDEVALAARGQLEQGICCTMIVTRGKDGMSVIDANGEISHIRGAARDVFDVSGAGDTVVSVLSLALASGGAVDHAAMLANIAAGIVVGKLGTAIVTTGEILGALRPIDGFSDDRKVFSLESVKQLSGEWKSHGLKVAFANGCFDLLHPGHISLLDQARRAADRLIVGLNSDLSVRRLKGEGRPVQSEISRATVLSSLKSVDAVVIFSEDTPLNLIEALLPDVLVKGSDYNVGEVAGADAVIRHGGRVVLAELLQGHSTTSTVKRVAGSRQSK